MTKKKSDNPEEKKSSQAEVERQQAIEAKVSAGLSREQAREVQAAQEAQEAHDKAFQEAEEKAKK